MIRSMQHNLGMKVLAVILAVAALGYTKAMDPIEGLWLELDVDIQLKDGTTLVEYETGNQTVLAYATGPHSRLLRLQAEAKAILNCRRLTQGEDTEVPYKLDHMIPGVEINFDPPSVIFTVNDIISADFIPEEVLLGNLQPGLQIGTTGGLPNTVKVEGASSLVNQVDRIIYNVNPWVLSAGSTELLVKFTPVDQDSEIIDYLAVYPSEKEIQLSLSSTKSRIVPVIVDYRGQIPPNYGIVSISHEPGIVEVSGQTDDLTDVNSIHTETVNLSNAISTIDRSVRLVVPSEVELSVDRVTIRVEIEPIKRPYTITGLQIEMRDMSPEYSYEMPVNTVDVTITISPSFTGTIEDYLIKPKVSLSECVPGSNQVEVMVQLPGGTELDSVDPKEITVIVSESGEPADGTSDETEEETPSTDEPQVEDPDEDPTEDPADEPVSQPE